MRGEKLIAPAWLASLAHDAKVEAFAAKELNQFLVPPPGQRSARDIILEMTGKHMQTARCNAVFDAPCTLLT